MLDATPQPNRQAVASPALVARDHLLSLSAERARALATGAGFDDVGLAAARAAFVGCAVTEIASLRAALSGPQAG